MAKCGGCGCVITGSGMASVTRNGHIINVDVPDVLGSISGSPTDIAVASVMATPGTSTNSILVNGYEPKMATYRATGAPDERAAVNAFLASTLLPGTKRIVGALSVSDSLSVQSNTDLDIYAATITQTGTSKVTLDLNGVSNVTIRGGRLVGTGVHIAGSTLSIGISVRNGSDNVRLVGLTATAHGGAGIKIDASTNVTARDCTVVGTSPPLSSGSAGSQFGILVEGTSARIDLLNNKVSATSQGIITSILSTSLKIHQNTITGITGQHGMYIQTNSRVSVIGNIVDSVALIGIKLQLNATATADARRVVVTDNAVSNTGSHGIVLGNVDPATPPPYRWLDAVVANNVITDTTEDGINIDTTARALVVGNVLRGITRHGIILKHCTDVKVSNNLLSSVGQIAIHLNSGTSTTMSAIKIDGNTIQDAGTANVASSNYGIFINLGTDVEVLNNTVRDSVGTMRYAFFFQTGDQTTLVARNNTFSGAVDYGARLIAATAVKEWTNNTCSGGLGTVLNLTTTLVTKVGMVGVSTVYQSSAVPSTGTFARGDICWNSTPSAAGAPGWVCTTAGSPGTWKAMAAVAA